MKRSKNAVQSTASETAIVRLGLATLTAFTLLAGAVLVSANAKIPVVTAPQTLINLSGVAVSPTNTGLPSQLQNHTNSDQVAMFVAQQLTAEQLKTNALNRMRGLPAYYKPVSPTLPMVKTVDVNAFLLSTRISNQSQLAELQMQPMFGEFDSMRFIAARTEPSTPITNENVKTFNGVGFPHIETNNRPDSSRYKPYKQLLSFNADGNGGIVPHIKCMGLSPESVATRAEKYDQQIYTLAVKHNVSASLVKAVVAKESCYNSKARSHVGAIGLMQLMPETAKWLKVKNPDNPQQNLAAGVRYLAQLRKRFGSNELALAAYNAGPGNVERYNGIPPFAETQQYVHDVMYFYRGYVATTRFVNAQNAI